MTACFLMNESKSRNVIIEIIVFKGMCRMTEQYDCIRWVTHHVYRETLPIMPILQYLSYRIWKTFHSNDLNLSINQNASSETKFAARVM